MSHTYFSERELGPRPRTAEVITQSAWGGICASISARITDGSFGYRYPYACPDNGLPIGCDVTPLSLALKSEVPDISWPLEPEGMPPTLVILDLLEFCFIAVGEPVGRTRHAFFEHHHLRFDAEIGQEKFRQDINRIFSRNGIVYELSEEGKIERLLPPVLGESLKSSIFKTGDQELDNLLNSARTKFSDPDIEVRREALEKLWDAWERLKTIESGRDKKTQIEELLKKTSREPAFRELLNNEGKTLTDVGNKFRIRHSETSQINIEQNEHIDYLFHRLFSLIRLVLRSTGRGE